MTEDKGFTLAELEEQMKAKQIELLTEALENICTKGFTTQENDFNCKQLAEAIWGEGIRGVYQI